MMGEISVGSGLRINEGSITVALKTKEKRAWDAEVWEAAMLYYIYRNGSLFLNVIIWKEALEPCVSYIVLVENRFDSNTCFRLCHIYVPFLNASSPSRRRTIE